MNLQKAYTSVSMLSDNGGTVPGGPLGQTDANGKVLRVCISKVIFDPMKRLKVKAVRLR